MAGRHVLAIDQETTGAKALVVDGDGIPGSPVDVPVVTGTTSLGSAHVAGLATGVFSDRGQVQRTRRTGRRCEPRMGKDQRQELYARRRQALERTKHWAREEA